VVLLAQRNAERHRFFLFQHLLQITAEKIRLNFRTWTLV
jgi:hypothetical protein